LLTPPRICLIPIFGIFASQYGARVVRGRPAWYVRVIAAFVFILAAGMDGLDGFLARRLNQRSRLGAILDPIADKGLVMMAIVVLALSNRSKCFPIWFPIAVIGRDAILVIGSLAPFENDRTRRDSTQQNREDGDIASDCVDSLAVAGHQGDWPILPGRTCNFIYRSFRLGICRGRDSPSSGGSGIAHFRLARCS
jgi:hypothetical protein